MNTTRSVLFALLSLGFLAGCGGDGTEDFNRLQEEGQAYHAKGESDKAIGYYEKALAILLKKLGAEHPRVATSYNNIGLAYHAKGEYDKAIGYYNKALAIQLKKLGAEHPLVGTSYYDLGVAYYNKGDKTKAMTYLLKAKATYLKTLGAQHPSTKGVQSWIEALK